MQHKVFMNALMNIVFTICLAILNNWALQNGFEETFITLVLVFGGIFVLGNALFIIFFFRK